MASEFDLIFAFKDRFGDEAAATIIKEIRCHPIIWDFLNEENHYLRIANTLEGGAGQWTLSLVIDAINQEFSAELLDQRDSRLIALLEKIEKIKNEFIVSVKGQEDFTSILQTILPFDTPTGLQKTIFSYFHQIGKFRLRIEKHLINSPEQGIPVFCFFLKNGLISDLEAFLQDHSRTLIAHPEIILNLYQELVKIGEEAKSGAVVNKYFDIIEADQNNDEFIKKQIDLNDAVHRLSVLRAIARIAGDEERKKNFEKQAIHLFEHSSEGLIDIEASDRDLLKTIDQIISSGQAAAKQQLRAWLKEKTEPEISGRGIGWTFSELESVSDKLISVGLIVESVEFLEMILSYQLNNRKIETKIAEICAQFGDYERSIHYFQPMFGENDLDRTQRERLAEAYENSGRWDRAHLVRQSINSVSARDELSRVLCIQKMGLEDPKDSIERTISEFHGTPIVKIFRKLIHGEVLSYRDLSLVNDEEVDDVIEICAGYLKTKNSSSYLTFLAETKHVSSRSKYLYLQEFSTRLPSVEISKLFTDLLQGKKFEDQRSYEDTLNLLFETGNISLLSNLMKLHENNWPLSKRQLQLRLHIEMEEKNHHQIHGLMETLVNHFPVDNTSLELYGIYLLGSSPSAIPYPVIENGVDLRGPNSFHEQAERLGGEPLSTTNQLLSIFILSNEPGRDLLSFAAKKGDSKGAPSWRIPYALGCYYFLNNQFDQAIIYLSESRRISPNNQNETLMLVRSFNQLKLYGEAIRLLKEETEKRNRFCFDDLRAFTKILYESNAYLDFLNDIKKDEPYYKDAILAIAYLQVLRNSPSEAEKTLLHAEREIDHTDNLLLQLSNLFRLAGNEGASRRVLEKFLSNNEYLNTMDLLLSAIIYYEMDLFEKSLNILSMIDESQISVVMPKTSLLIALGETREAEHTLLKAIASDARRDVSTYFSADEVPESWISPQPEMLEPIFKNLFRKSDLDHIHTIAGSILNRHNLKNEALLELLIAIEVILGEFGLLDEIGKRIDQSVQKANANLLSAKIDKALINGHEVEAAELIRNAEDHSLESEEIQLLKARMQLRQGLISEPKSLINEIYEKYLRTKNPDSIEFRQIAFQTALSEALLDAKQFGEAYVLIKQSIAHIGFTDRLANIYSTALEAVIRQKNVDQALSVVAHQDKLDESDEHIFQKFSAFSGRDENHIEKHKIEVSVGISPEWADISFGDRDVSNPLRENINLIAENPQEALKNLLFQLKTDPNNPRLLSALSKAYSELDDTQNAYTALNLALEFWPEESLWHLQAAELCEKLGDNLNAARHRKEAGKADNTGSDLLMRGMPGELSEISGSDPINIQEFSIRQLPDLVAYVEKLIRWGNLTQAQDYIENIEAINGRNSRTQFLQASLLHAKQDYAGAEKVLREILDGEENNLTAFIKLADLYIQIGKFSQASKMLDTMKDLGINPSGESLFLRAKLIFSEQGIDNAIRFIRSRADGIKDTEFLNQCAKLMLENSRVDLSKEFSNAALQLDSSDGNTLLIAARISQIQGDLDKAIEYLHRSITQDPYKGEPYMISAEIYEVRRQYEMAQRILEEGVKHNPFDFALLKFAGKYYSNHGFNKKSQEYFESAITINPYDEDLKHNLRSLRNHQLG